MRGVARLALAVMLASCSPLPGADGPPVLDVSVNGEVIGSVGAGTWCRTSLFRADECVAADGPVPEFRVECEVDVDFAPRGPGWLLVSANAAVDEFDDHWTIGSARGDVLIDMESAGTEASWFFIIERSAC